MSYLWGELHRRAIIYGGLNDDIFLNIWANKIPNFEGGCRCRSFYNNWRRLNPPTFKNYFEWTVKLHNAVNRKLNKPEITLEDAIKRWSS